MKNENTAIRLKKIMQERNLRQIDIVKLTEPYCKKYKIKFGKNDLSQYLSGKVEPSQKKIAILSLALDVSPAWLMGFDINQTSAKKIDFNLNDRIIMWDDIMGFQKGNEVPIDIFIAEITYRCNLITHLFKVLHFFSNSINKDLSTKEKKEIDFLLKEVLELDTILVEHEKNERFSVERTSKKIDYYNTLISYLEYTKVIFNKNLNKKFDPKNEKKMILKLIELQKMLKKGKIKPEKDFLRINFVINENKMQTDKEDGTS